MDDKQPGLLRAKPPAALHHGEPVVPTSLTVTPQCFFICPLCLDPLHPCFPLGLLLTSGTRTTHFSKSFPGGWQDGSGSKVT